MEQQPTSFGIFRRRRRENHRAFSVIIMVVVVEEEDGEVQPDDVSPSSLLTRSQRYGCTSGCTAAVVVYSRF